MSISIHILFTWRTEPRLHTLGLSYVPDETDEKCKSQRGKVTSMDYMITSHDKWFIDVEG